MEPIKNIPLLKLKHLGENRIKGFTALGISSLSQILFYFPRKYLDRQKIAKVNDLNYLRFNDAELPGEVNFIGRFRFIKLWEKKKRKTLTALFSDGTGSISCSWFIYADFLKKKIKESEEYLITGKLSRFRNNLQISQPVIEKLSKVQEGVSVRTGRIIPVYSLSKELQTAGIDNNLLRKIIFQALEDYKSEINASDLLPEYLKKKHKFFSLSKELFAIHFPDEEKKLYHAQKRFKYEELLQLSLVMLGHKNKIKKKASHLKISSSGEYVKKLYKLLPFDLTTAQKRVVKEIYEDLTKGSLMNRLVQGDVGSGKTIVSLLAILIMVGNGYQTALMAPTEILAEQHYLGFKKLCETLDINISLLTGKMRKKIKDEVLSNIANGISQIVVGTHALIQKNVQFQNLGLAIVDEQHRFGVVQRGELLQKNKDHTHLLVMTATPIPRTITLSLYGDLDVSLIDEMPANRKSVKTAIRREAQLAKVYSFIREEVRKKHRAYIIFPLIEENEDSALSLKSCMEGYYQLKEEIFMDLKLGFLHGKLSSLEKEEVMQQFKRGDVQVLCSTTVVEVGVDVQEATVILIMNSERFGLSQLHQLRGRVGRNDLQSYCVLHTPDDAREESLVRLNVLVNHSSGFKIAEEDFALRGPGEFFGERQSGMLDLKLVDLKQDHKLLLKAREDAENLLKNDPFLENYQELKKHLNNKFQDKVDFLAFS